MSFRPLVDQLAIEVNTAVGRRRAIRFPEIGHDRLPGREPLQFVQRHGEPIGPDVFAKGEKGAMFSQIIDRRPDALIDLDLLDARVALDVKNALALQQIVIEFLSPADIEDRVRLAVELSDFR